MSAIATNGVVPGECDVVAWFPPPHQTFQSSLCSPHTISFLQKVNSFLTPVLQVTPALQHLYGEVFGSASPSLKHTLTDCVSLSFSSWGFLLHDLPGTRP